ncbi:HutD family protein [Leeia sp. TBRC 13508]|uniref:HutD family protein n=1 Tax=Leeia speluncae TaxID=2884804 RepID=A0ABS8DAL7_9NEIS|nr:HutD family protein [Leeia speluncae]MCB6184961.1 HutD family protein [Leeia speluncae]
MLDVYSIHKAAPVRWKNGLGKTRLLFSGNSSQSTSVRVSLAFFNKTVEFSQFPGIHRTSILLNHSDIQLDFEDGESAKLNYLTPFRYKGDRALLGNVISGEPNIFNVMSESEAIRTDVITIENVGSLGPGKFVCMTLNDIEVNCDGELKQVTAGNMLMIETNQTAEIRSIEDSKKSRLIVVTI